MIWSWKRGPQPAGPKFTLVERSAEAFRAYLNGPLRNVFYEKEYRDELAKRFAYLDGRLSRALRTCLLLVAALVFSDTVQELSIAEGLVHIPSLKPFRDAIVFLLAVSSVAFSLAALDYVVLERYLKQIYFSANVAHPRFFYMHIFPVGVWNDLFLRRFTGPISLSGHNAFRTFLLIVFLVLVAGIVFVSPVTAFVYAVQIVGDTAKPQTMRALGAFDALMAFSAPLVLVVGWFGPFRFAHAESDEATGQPTAEFVARLEKEQVDQKGSATAGNTQPKK